MADSEMTGSLWRITVSSLFPNDHRLESIYEGRHANGDAARDAALTKEAIDHGGSTIPAVVRIEEIG